MPLNKAGVLSPQSLEQCHPACEASHGFKKLDHEGAVAASLLWDISKPVGILMGLLLVCGAGQGVMQDLIPICRARLG